MFKRQEGNEKKRRRMLAMLLSAIICIMTVPMSGIKIYAQDENVEMIQLGESFSLEKGKYYQIVPEKSGYFTFYDDDGEYDCYSGGIYNQNMELLAENSGGITGYWSFNLTMYFERGKTYYLVMDSFESGCVVSSVENMEIKPGEQREVVIDGYGEAPELIIKPETHGLYCFSQYGDSEIICDLYDITESKCIVLMKDKVVLEMKKGHVYKVSIGQGLGIDEITMPCIVQLELLEQTGSAWNGEIASGFSTGDGFQNSPYQIKNAAELAYLAKAVNEGNSMEGKYFELVDDIILNDTENFDNWKQQAPQYNWISIGMDRATSFGGVFEGNGHTVSGMYSKRNLEYIGLFGVLSDTARIENLNLQDCHVENKNAASETFLGGIAAVNYGKIIQCNCLGKFSGLVGSNSMEPDTNAGNIIGTIAGNNLGIVQESSNKCTMTNYNLSDGCYWGYNGRAGGVVGVIGDDWEKSGIVWKCHNESMISISIAEANDSRSNEIGGVVGVVVAGAVVDCWNAGDIKGSISYDKHGAICMGGVVGSSYGEVINTYNVGRLNVADELQKDNLSIELGGIAGGLSSAWSSSSGENWIGRIYNSYNIGSFNNVETGIVYIGELAGDAGKENSISHSYWLKQGHNCCGEESFSNINNCSAFDNSQKLEQEILATNNLCEALNRWGTSSGHDASYAEYCTSWEVREDKNNGFPVLVDTMLENVISLSVNTMPEKSEYVVGENFDKKGLTLSAAYISGDTKIVSEDEIVVNEYDFSKPGECTVTVSYKGKDVTFPVLVKEEHFHKYISTITRQPSCTVTGIMTFSCLECEDKYEEVIPVAGHIYHSDVDKATAKKNGVITNICTRCGEKTTTTIYIPKTIKLSKTNIIYNDKTQKPSVTIKDSKGRVLSSKTDYTVSYPKTMKNVGSYTVTIKFKGNYSGTVKKNFTIVPKDTSISKITPKKKGFTVKWKKQTAQTTGYEIAYSTDSKFSKKNAKIVPVGRNKTTSKSVSKLKDKKKYYVRIRTYKKVGGRKYYSGWSKVRNVNTK